MDKKKTLLNTLFLVLVFGITIYCVFHGQNLSELASYIRNADTRYWIVSAICVVMFICGESVIIYYMMRTIGQNHISMWHCVLYSFVGFFFSCVTPGATGGQPMQLYYMNKDKVPLSVGTLVLMIVTITYKLVLVVIGGVVFIFRPAEVMKYLQPVLGWCYLGFALNIFAVVSMFILVFHPTLATNIVNLLIKLLDKVHLLRHKEKIQKKADAAMTQYRDVAVYFQTHKTVVWNVFLLTCLQRGFMFYVTYLTYRSFGFAGIGMPVIVTLSGMISVAVDMLPLPGGMGVTEKLFMVMFKPIFENMTLAVMVVSRGLSYYTELLISAIFTIVAHLCIGRGVKE